VTVRVLSNILTLACCMLAGSPVTAQLTGTLFTSPAQREYLDYLRQDFLARSRERGFDISEAEIPDIPGAVAEAAQVPVLYTLGGIVTLRDGTQRIWLNGTTLSEAELPSEARLIRDNGAPALRFTTATGSYVLRPGQTLELTAGSVMENYQRPTLEDADSSAESTPAIEDAGASVALATETAPATGEPEDLAVITSEESSLSAETASETGEAAGIEELQQRLQVLEQAQFGQEDDD